MGERELFDRHPANPILTAEDWPYPVNAVFNPAARVVDGETVLLARVEDLTRDLASLRRSLGERDRRLDDRRGAAARSRPTASRASSGASRTRGRLGRGARALGDHLHRLRPGRPGRLSSRRPRTSRSSSATGSSVKPEDKNAALLPAPSRRQVDPLPPADDRLRRRPRRDPPLALRRPGQLERARAGAAAARTAPGGTRCASASGRRSLRTEHGWLLIYHGVKETVAGAHLPGRARPPRPRRADPGAAAAAPELGLRAARRPTSGWATCPNVVFPCGLVHDRATRRAPPLLRRRRHVDLPRDGATRRSARGRARRPRPSVRGELAYALRDSRRPSGRRRTGRRPERGSPPGRGPPHGWTAATASSTSSTRKPVGPSSISSPIEPRSKAITGVPHAIASTTLYPNGSSKPIEVQERVRPAEQLRPIPRGPTGPTKDTRSPSSRGATRSSKYRWSWTIPAMTSGNPDAAAMSMASAVPLSGWILPKKSR